MAFSVSIVTFSVETSLCKGHVFQLNIVECRITVFLRNNVKYGHIEISRKPKNRYCKLCIILVIDNYCIFLTVKLLPPLSKGKLLLIHTCLSNNHHKGYPSRFDRRTQQIKYLIQPLDVHVYSPSENVSCDSFLLWQNHPFTPCIMAPRYVCSSWYFPTAMNADFSSLSRIALTRATLRSSPNISSRYCSLMSMDRTS